MTENDAEHIEDLPKSHRSAQILSTLLDVDARTISAVNCSPRVQAGLEAKILSSDSASKICPRSTSLRTMT